MYKRNQSNAFQTIFLDVSKFQNFFVKNEKNLKIWFKLSQIYGSIIIFAYFKALFSNTNSKKIFPRRGVTYTLQGKYYPDVKKNYL